MLTDDQIAAMTADQRRELILRLSRSVGEVLPTPRTVRRIRTLRVLVTGGGSLLLVPWTVYLAAALPGRYVVRGWPAVWIGFDLLLLAMLAVTAWLGWHGRQAFILTSFATGVLVLADAWFDVMTASRGDTVLSVAAAVLIEIPVGYLLISGAIRLMRLTAVRFLVLPPDTKLWRLPMPLLAGSELGMPGRGRPFTGV
jgi:hypothetical protein